MTRRKNRVRVEEVAGAWAIIPTPSRANASDLDAVDTVDLDEAARVAEALVQSGVDGILTLGTLGEGATLSWDEKRAFMATVAETVRGRVPYFGGTTAMGTAEVVRQTRAAHDLGVDGTMLGLPMWCKLDTANAVQFYRDVAQACPEMAICVYANPEAFKFEFPRPFWAQVAEIPQVVAAKYLNIAQLFTDLRLTKGRIRFLTTDGDHYAAARIDPENCTGFWSSGAACGPAVATRLRDEVRAAKASGDWSGAKALTHDIKAALAPLFPGGNYAEFAKYNIALEKARVDAAGWMKAGPCRRPYQIAPEGYLEGAQQAGKMWATLEKKVLGK